MNRIKELRKRQKLTQDELSKKLKINLRTIQKWENGESAIRSKNAQALADFFGVSVGYLLGYSDYENEEDIKDISYSGEEIQNASGVVLDLLAQLVGEKRMPILIDKLSDRYMSLFITNYQPNNKHSEAFIYYSLLDEEDQEIIYELLRSLSNKVKPRN